MPQNIALCSYSNPSNPQVLSTRCYSSCYIPSQQKSTKYNSEAMLSCIQ